MLLALFTLLRMKKNIASSKESSADSVCLFYSVFVLQLLQSTNTTTLILQSICLHFARRNTFVNSMWEKNLRM